MQRSDRQLNVLLLLQSHMVHIILAINMVSILPSLSVSAGQLLPHSVAEFISMAIGTLVCLLVILTASPAPLSSSSCMFTHFGPVFALDPQQLAWHILCVGGSLRLIHNLVFTLRVLLVFVKASNPVVSYFVGARDDQNGISFSRFYILPWLSVSLILALLVVYGIPVYLKRRELTPT